MTRRARTIGLLLVAAGSAAAATTACGPSGPQLGSQTNWLVQCDVTDECGELSCVCGACTRACEVGACDDLPGSVCVAQAEPGVVALCGGESAPSALCLPRCDDGTCESGTVCVSGVCVPSGDATSELTIDVGTRYQPLVGFGAGIGFTEDLIAQHPAADELYDVLFAESGLDALRIRNRYEGGNEADLLVLAGIVDVVSARLERTPALFLSEGSPPPSLKANGSRGCASNFDTCTLLQTEPGVFDYAGFAEHWRTSLVAYANAGIVFDYLGIQNHPNFVPGGEGGEACRFLPQQGTEMVTVDGAEVEAAFPGYLEAHAAVESALADLEERPILTAPDTTGVATVGEYVAPMNAAAVGALSIHLYGMDPAAVDTAQLEAIRTLSTELGVPVLQTEHRVPVRETAILLHHALTSAGAAAYLQNDLVAKNEEEESIALVRLTEDAYETLPLYDLFSHYARWTDPGWTRVDAQFDSEGILASAWLAPDEGALTVVLQNPTETELRPRVLVPSSLEGAVTQSRVVRTVFAGVERLASLGPLPEDGIVRMPPGSVVTVAFTTE